MMSLYLHLVPSPLRYSEILFSSCSVLAELVFTTMSTYLTEIFTSTLSGIAKDGKFSYREDHGQKLIACM